MVTFTFDLENSYFEKLNILKKADAMLKAPEYKDMSFNTYAETLIKYMIREKISKLKETDPDLYNHLKEEAEE